MTWTGVASSIDMCVDFAAYVTGSGFTACCSYPVLATGALHAYPSSKIRIRLWFRVGKDLILLTVASAFACSAQSALVSYASDRWEC